jgi:GAF domain-containing protein
MRVSLRRSNHILATRVFNDRQPLYVNNAAEQDDMRTSRAGGVTWNANAIMGVPLLREGNALGVLILVRNDVG